MRWLTVALVVLAMAVIYLIYRVDRIERAMKPSIHPIMATASK